MAITTAPAVTGVIAGGFGASAFPAVVVAATSSGVSGSTPRQTCTTATAGPLFVVDRVTEVSGVEPMTL